MRSQRSRPLLQDSSAECRRRQDTGQSRRSREEEEEDGDGDGRLTAT